MFQITSSAIIGAWWGSVVTNNEQCFIMLIVRYDSVCSDIISQLYNIPAMVSKLDQYISCLKCSHSIYVCVYDYMHIVCSIIAVLILVDNVSNVNWAENQYFITNK